jgi:hypothetical protein
MSGGGFARMNGIKYQTFAGWRQRRNNRRQFKPDSPKPLQLIEAVVAAKSDVLPIDHGLMVHLPGGSRMELSDVAQVPAACALLKALEVAYRSC